MTTVVWFKRDLRLDDHGPLSAAAALAQPVIALYVVEPGYWQLDDTSERHWRFIAESLRELDHQLRQRGNRLYLHYGSVPDALADLHRRCGIQRLFCHQETGGRWTFERDIAVAGWCQSHGVALSEWHQFGVVRRLANRDDWDHHWRQRMLADCLPPPPSLPAPPSTLPASPWREPACRWHAPCPERQPGGSHHGQRLLDSFLSQRCLGYQYRISSPNTAVSSCSRLSPHLAYGTVSLRRLYQQSKQAGDARVALPRKQRSLTRFRSRLHWHCHFIQKLEDEPELEFRAVHRDLEHLKSAPGDPERLQRWQQGMTGWPLVDATMRALAHTGWINFRLRAMVMAVASYQLWLHWRQPALHLARLFTDFEPGIHYPQVQMQGGLTGINALRIYDPVRQSQQLDPHGQFLRQWLPELSGLPDDLIHTPWLLSHRQQQRYGSQAYPKPICDHQLAARQARQAIGQFRQQRLTNDETRRVLNRHGSRKGPKQSRPRPLIKDRQPPAMAQQLSLFDD